MDLTFNQLFKACTKVLEGGRVPMITSKPGMGKSSLARALADYYNLAFLDIRLTTYDTVSLNGYPTVDAAANRSTFIPMGVIPIQGRDKLPKGKEGWLINFDELPDCNPTMQSAAYKILLDRYVGEHPIHDNGIKHGGAAHRLTGASKSRMVHFGLAPDAIGWCDWGTSAGIDYRLISFIQEFPDLLNNFDIKTINDVDTFACERTYEILSDCVKDEPAYDETVLPVMHGCIGEAAATQLYSYVNIFAHLPSVDAIIKDPYVAGIPQEPSSRAALINKLVAHVDQSNIDPIFKYIKRFDSEYVMLAATRVLRKDRSFRTHPQIRTMVAQYSREFDFLKHK